MSRHIKSVPDEEWVSFDEAARQLGHKGQTMPFGLLHYNFLEPAKHAEDGRFGTTQTSVDGQKQRVEEGGVKLALQRIWRFFLSGI